MRTVVACRPGGFALAPRRALGRAGHDRRGAQAGVAVDAAGTAYIAWYGPEAGDTSLRFCRLARGATACAGQAVLPTTGLVALTRPVRDRRGRAGHGAAAPLRRVPRRLQPALPVHVGSTAATRFDGGAVAGLVPFDEAVAGPGDTVAVATNAFQEGGVVQNMPLVRRLGAARRARRSSPTRPYNGTVGLDGESAGRGLRHRRPATPRSGASRRGRAQRRGELGRRRSAIGYADYPQARRRAAPASSCCTGPRRAGSRCGAGTGRRSPTRSTLARPATTRRPVRPGRRRAPARASGRASTPTASTSSTPSPTTASSWDSGSLLVVQPDATSSPDARRRGAPTTSASWRGRARAQIRVAASGPGAPGVPLPEFGKTVVLGRSAARCACGSRARGASWTSTEVDDVPLGSTVDTRRAASSSPRSRRAPEPSRRSSFTTGSSAWRRRRGITEFALNESLASCRRARAAAKKPKTRKLWGDGKGRFRTKGTLQRGDRPRHALARPGLLRGHAHAGDRRAACSCTAGASASSSAPESSTSRSRGGSYLAGRCASHSSSLLCSR